MSQERGGRVLTAVIRRKGQVTLPAALRRRFSLGEGDVLMIVVRQTSLELVPVRLAGPDRLWCLNPTVQARIEAAEEDLENGRVAVASGPRSILRALEE